jgi:hypothetical protein
VNKPSETDVDRLRQDLEKRIAENERQITFLRGRVNKIIENINRRPGPQIE